MAALENGFWLVVVGILWGMTNPLIKLGSKGVTELPKQRNGVLQVMSEMYFLFTRWQYLLPFLLNMSGSVVFYYTLSNTQLSLVVPITNSLTFLFTTIMSRILGEQQINLGTVVGIVLVLVGVSICVLSKT